MCNSDADKGAYLEIPLELESFLLMMMINVD